MVIADFFLFKIEALHCDWKTWQPKNAQFMTIADLFNFKSKRFTVIGVRGNLKMRSFLWRLQIIELKIKAFLCDWGARQSKNA